MRFRGREHAHRNAAWNCSNADRKDLEEFSVEQRPMMEGRQMVMVLGPRGK